MWIEEEAVAEEPAVEVFPIRDFLFMYGEHSEVRRQVMEVMEQDAHGERILQELWETSWAPGFQAYDDEGKAKQAPTLLHTIDCSLSGVVEKATRRRSSSLASTRWSKGRWSKVAHDASTARTATARGLPRTLGN